MTIMYCGNCEAIIYEGKTGRRALDVRDIHEFEHDHFVVEFAEIDEQIVVVRETIEV
jgi:hypothetical protein